MSKGKTISLALAATALVLSTACSKDDDDKMDAPAMRSTMFHYAFNTGQVGAGTEYNGTHPGDLSAMLTLKEKSSGTEVTITLMNTVDGETYPVHSHDAADPSTTPNGTPYNESPNAGVLVGMVQGNGGTASFTQNSSMDYDDLITNYNGFLVVHDPTQTISTTDLTTYLIVGAFAR